MGYCWAGEIQEPDSKLSEGLELRLNNLRRKLPEVTIKRKQMGRAVQSAQVTSRI